MDCLSGILSPGNRESSDFTRLQSGEGQQVRIRSERAGAFGEFVVPGMGNIGIIPLDHSIAHSKGGTPGDIEVAINTRGDRQGDRHKKDLRKEGIHSLLRSSPALDIIWS